MVSPNRRNHMQKGDLRILLTVAAVVLLPFVFLIWSWHHLLTSGSWWPAATFGMSFVAACMAGLPIVNFLLPGKMGDNFAQRGKYGQIAWIALVVAAFLVASVNYALMDRTFYARQAAPVYNPSGQQ